MKKFMLILISMALVSCGQENLKKTIATLEESLDEVTIVIVDEASNSNEANSETPYHHEVTDDNTVSDIPGDNESDNTDLSEEDYGQADQADNNSNDLDDGQSDTELSIEEKITFSKDVTVYRGKDKSLYFTRDGRRIEYSTLSETVNTKSENIKFPYDSYLAKIHYNVLNVKESILQDNTALTKIDHILDIELMEESEHPERQNLNEFEFCGTIYIDQTPIKKNTNPIYIKNIYDGKIYRVYRELKFTTSLDRSYLNYKILQRTLKSTENQEQSGCIYTDETYYFNYELPEYRRIIDIKTYNIGW